MAKKAKKVYPNGKKWGESEYVKVQGTEWLICELLRGFSQAHSLSHHYQVELELELNIRIEKGGLEEDTQNLIDCYWKMAEAMSRIDRNAGLFVFYATKPTIIQGGQENEAFFPY